MTNKGHTVLYTGCTNDLVRRVSEHKSHKYKGSFSDTYNCEYCVYYKEFTSYQAAIDEENRIKGLSRKAKIAMIEKKPIAIPAGNLTKHKTPFLESFQGRGFSCGPTRA